MLAAALLVGEHGAISAAAGGLVSIVAGLASAFVASRGDAKSAEGILIGALRAEGVKIGLIVILLWLLLATSGDVVPISLFLSILVLVGACAVGFFFRGALSGDP